MGMKLNRNSIRWTVTLVIILLVAFALRVIQLDRRPLWWDEGNSVYFAHQGLSALVNETRTTNDTDPPVYRLALGGWGILAGSSPFAVRFFSALLGVVAVALTWVVGCWQRRIWYKRFTPFSSPASCCIWGRPVICWSAGGLGP